VGRSVATRHSGTRSPLSHCGTFRAVSHADMYARLGTVDVRAIGTSERLPPGRPKPSRFTCEVDASPEPTSVAAYLDTVPLARFSYEIDLPLPGSSTGLDEGPKFDSRTIPTNEDGGGSGASAERDLTVQPRFADSHLSAPVRDAQDHSADCEQDQQRHRHGYPGRWHPIFRRNVSSVAEQLRSQRRTRRRCQTAAGKEPLSSREDVSEWSAELGRRTSVPSPPKDAGSGGAPHVAYRSRRGHVSGHLDPLAGAGTGRLDRWTTQHAGRRLLAC